MEIRQQYLQKYLHDIALDQLAADYKANDYVVTKEEKLDQLYEADLVARKGDEVIVVEVKTGRMTATKRKRLTELGDYVRAKSYKFLVVIATPPRPKKIDIPNLNQLLFNYLIDHFPSTLDTLSSRTHITDVSGSHADEVTVRENGSITVTGSGVVEVSLNHGTQSDSAESTDNFPFTFDVLLNRAASKELVIEEMKNLAIDTSDFYE